MHTIWLLLFWVEFCSATTAHQNDRHHTDSGDYVGLWTAAVVRQQLHHKAYQPTDLVEEVAQSYRSSSRLLGIWRGGRRRSRKLQAYDENDEASKKILVIIFVIIFAVVITWCKCMIRQKKNKNTRLPNDHHQQQRNNTQPRLVTAAAIIQRRSSPEARVDIGFVGTDYAEITRIQHYSRFHGSELVPGMKVVSINNISIGSARQAGEILLRSAASSNDNDVLLVTILAHSPGYYGSTENYVTATAVKERLDQPLGISYKKEFSHGPIRLGTISETSLLLLQSAQHGTTSTTTIDLTPGMEVVAVNNVPVQSLAQATELTRSAFPLVTILARRSAAVVVAEIMETSLVHNMVDDDTNNNNIGTEPIVAEPIIAQSYAIGDEPLVLATATTAMIEDNNRGGSVEL